MINTQTSICCPQGYLECLLEAATLYSLIFRPNEGAIREDVPALNDFVIQAFGSFLEHVRLALSEWSVQRENEISSEPSDENDVQVNEEEEDAAFSNVSRQLSHLLHSVRELASALALPDVGVKVEVASSLVDQTVNITEALVRRRVSQKFDLLRVRVLEECIGPFLKDIVSSSTDESGDAGSSHLRLIQAVQLGNAALSNSIQLVSDSIRSIKAAKLGFSANVDSGIIKAAVRMNARRFSLWLAGSLEVMAGCDPSDIEMTLELR